MEYTQEEWYAEYESRKSCRNDLSEYGEWSLDNNARPISAALHGAIKKYGEDCVRDVFAATVNGAEWDKRYDRYVREWALDIPHFPQPPGYEGKPITFSEFCIRAHPCSINIAVRRYMDEQRNVVQKKHGGDVR